jgi:hypothetical protein
MIETYKQRALEEPTDAELQNERIQSHEEQIKTKAQEIVELKGELDEVRADQEKGRAMLEGKEAPPAETAAAAPPETPGGPRDPGASASGEVAAGGDEGPAGEDGGEVVNSAGLFEKPADDRPKMTPEQYKEKAAANKVAKGSEVTARVAFRGIKKGAKGHVLDVDSKAPLLLVDFGDGRPVEVRPENLKETYVHPTPSEVTKANKTPSPFKLELPEAVKLIKNMMGKYPQIVKALRSGPGGGEPSGRFSAGGPRGMNIRIRADIFEDMEDVAKTLYHELGHLDPEPRRNHN